MANFTWRGLTFEQAEARNGIEGPFCCGHWTVWKPRTIWTAVWQDQNSYVVAVETSASADATAALEQLLSRLHARLDRERAHILGLEQSLAPYKAACAALEQDLEQLGVRASQ